MRVQRYLMGLACAVLMAGAGDLAAQPEQGRGGQGRGGAGFDPAAMRQRMIENYRERIGVESDAEWRVIQARIEAVLDARNELNALQVQGFGRGGGGRGAAAGGGAGGGAGARGGAGGGGRGGGGGQTSAEIEALRQAVDSNASADDLRARLAATREARKVKQANLEKAQEELRKLLSVRQEANAFLAGLL